MNEHVIDLEARLSGDDAGAHRDELRGKLAEDLARVRRRLDVGLPPEEFKRCGLVRDALEAADRVVVGYWQMTHAGPRP